MTDENKTNADAPASAPQPATKHSATNDALRALLDTGRIRHAFGIGGADSLAMSWLQNGQPFAPPSALPGARLWLLVAIDVPANKAVPAGLITFADKPNTETPAPAAAGAPVTGQIADSQHKA